MIILSIRDKINNGNFAHNIKNLRKDTTILTEYKNYTDRIRNDNGTTVMHEPDQVHISVKDSTISQSYQEIQSTTRILEKTQIKAGSHIDGNPDTDDFIEVEQYTNYEGENKTTCIQYIQTMDEGKEVIVKKEKDRFTYESSDTHCTEVDKEGYILDEWTIPKKKQFI